RPRPALDAPGHLPLQPDQEEDVEKQEGEDRDPLEDRHQGHPDPLGDAQAGPPGQAGRVQVAYPLNQRLLKLHGSPSFRRICPPWRSTSPKTGSRLPMTATRSAIRRPLLITGISCKWTKEGARQWRR